MGLGGQWEQTGTSCDKPEVRLAATRDRVIRIRVKSTCDGAKLDLPFKGTWRLDGDHVVITLPTRGKQVSAEDEAALQVRGRGRRGRAAVLAGARHRLRRAPDPPLGLFSRKAPHI